MIGVGVYVRGSAQAVELYEEVFGLELGYNVRNPDGSFFHSELYKDGKEILCVVESSERGFGQNNVQLGYEFDSPAEVERAYKLLSEGGSIDVPIGPLPWSPCAATVTDRFGVWWYISACSHRPDDDFEVGQ